MLNMNGKIRKSTRHLAVLLAALLVCSGCAGSAGNDDTSGTTENTSSPSSEETTTSLMSDDLPENDFEGREFRIFSRLNPWYHGNWLVEEADGDVLNDAIYTRNSKVEERFNITFTEDGDTNTDRAKNSIIAGDDSYDIINARGSAGFEYAQENLLYSITDLPYINLEKSYWDKKLNDCVSMCGKSFFPIGASNLTSYDYTHVLVFNKKLADDNNVGDLYSLVSSGKWTLDEYAKIVDTFSKDLNGDSVMDEEDLYGYLSQPKAVLPAFWIASGVLSVNRNEADEPVFTMPTDEKFLNIFERVFAITYDNNSWFRNSSETNYDDQFINMFQNNKALFMDITFFYIESLRNMDADFGIIPYPKYDENQANYLSRIENCELTCVPVTADPEFTSIILEAMASESVDTVVKAYYNVALKTKFARDNESADMLDIIFNNRVYDLGDTVWGDKLRDGVFKEMFTNNDRAISSKFESMRAIMEKTISDAVKGFSSAGN